MSFAFELFFVLFLQVLWNVYLVSRILQIVVMLNKAYLFVWGSRMYQKDEIEQICLWSTPDICHMFSIGGEECLLY